MIRRWLRLKEAGWRRGLAINVAGAVTTGVVTVVLPEFIARHWWEQLLHNQTAPRIKAALLFRPGTVVTSVPYHLERSNPKVPTGGAGIGRRL